jgi:hypothetical protein
VTLGHPRTVPAVLVADDDDVVRGSVSDILRTRATW